MIKVRLLVHRASSVGMQFIGDVVEVTSDEADRMIGAGQAEIVRATPAEKAVPRRKTEKASK